MTKLTTILFLMTFFMFEFFQNTICEKKLESDLVFQNYRRARNNLLGKQLRVVTGHFPPAMSIFRNSSGHVIGYSDQLYYQLLYLAEKLKFDYTIFPANENTNGIKLSNGSWNGVIGTLLRDEADLGVVPMAISLERYEAIDFCGRMGGDYSGILVRYPDARVSFTSAVEVFSIGIWAGLVISGTAIVAISKIMSYVMAKILPIRLKKRNDTGTIAWYLYSIILSQGNYFSSRQLSQKLLAATWCLVAFVFVNIYNSTLTSYMSVTYQKPDINSFDDLASNPSYRAMLLTGSIQDIDLPRSRIEALKVVSDKVKKCSADCRTFNLNDLATSVLNKDNYVSLLPFSTGIHFLQKYNSERKKCRLAMAYEKLSWKPMFFAVRKFSPYTEEINRETLWFIDVGLRDYWYGIYEKLPRQCQLNYNSKGVASKRISNRIKLEQFYLPFLILFGGYLLAFVVFCYEQLRVAFLKKKIRSQASD